MKRNLFFYEEEHSLFTLYINTSDYNNITSFEFLTQDITISVFNFFLVKILWVEWKIENG